jgi:hypothetical protein
MTPAEVAFIAWCVVCVLVIIWAMAEMVEEGWLVAIFSFLFISAIATMISAFLYDMLIVRMPS